MQCPSCSGLGRRRGRYHEVTCRPCEGTGELHVTLDMMNGLSVRVRDTGFTGICHVTSCGDANVVNDQDEEVCDLRAEDLELLDEGGFYDLD